MKMYISVEYFLFFAAPKFAYSEIICIFAAEGSEYGLRLSNSSELDCTRLAPSLPPKTKKLRL